MMCLWCRATSPVPVVKLDGKWGCFFRADCEHIVETARMQAGASACSAAFWADTLTEAFDSVHSHIQHRQLEPPSFGAYVRHDNHAVHTQSLPLSLLVPYLGPLANRSQPAGGAALVHVLHPDRLAADRKLFQSTIECYSFMFRLQQNDCFLLSCQTSIASQALRLLGRVRLAY